MKASTSIILAAALLTSASHARPAATPLKAAPFNIEAVAKLERPWAMTFLPDGSLLVTEKGGKLRHVSTADGSIKDIRGVPEVADQGQGGLGDIALHPGFPENGIIYLSYAENGPGNTKGAALARARLVLAPDGSGQLEQLEVIWRQIPKVTGNGHYGHRIVFGPDGKLWLSSSERQKFDPAQDLDSSLGKILRLNDDGTPAADNPFADRSGPGQEVWSWGHRNVLGMAFDDQGRLWSNEMGPRGGDELNLIQRGGNYGYPLVSNGNHYSGMPIPNHDTRPEFIAPAVTWTPVISPSSLHIYQGDQFPDWKGQALIGGLSSQALVRVVLDGTQASEAERYDMGERIRAVTESADGAIWLLEDGSGGRLLRLVPRDHVPAQ